MKCEDCNNKKAKCWFFGKRICDKCYIINKFKNTPNTLRRKLKSFYQKRGIVDREKINRFINEDFLNIYKEVAKMVDEENETSEEEKEEETTSEETEKEEGTEESAEENSDESDEETKEE